MVDAAPALSKTYTLKRGILSPDGKPAVGALVTVRGTGGKVLCQGKTDSKGTFAGQLPDEHDLSSAYVTVTAPQAALLVSLPRDWSATDHAGALQLVATKDGYNIRGKVSSRKNVPVKNARVVLIDVTEDTMAPWHLNKDHGAMVPELAATTADDGSYSIPSFVVDTSESLMHADLLASATVEGKREAALVDNQRLKAPIDITLFATTEVRGVILDAVTKHPAPGVDVSYFERTATGGYVFSAQPPAVSDAKGRFVLKDVPLQGTLNLTGKGSGYVSGKMEIAEEKAKPYPALMDGVSLHLTPLVTVSGKVVEESTGKAPLTRVDYSSYPSQMTVKATNPSVSQEGEKFKTEAEVQPDGSFSLKVPAGRNTLALDATGYQFADGKYSADLAVENDGMQNHILKVRKCKGNMLHFTTANPDTLSQYFFGKRKPGEQNWQRQALASEYLFVGWNGSNWGDKMEIQITRRDNDRIVVPAMEIVSAEDKWIKEIALP
jgi:hypothetical protein